MLGNKGDTIVEVMIAMAALGLVLGFSYSSATRSLNMAQDAKERATAMRLAESQVELMKSYLNNGGAPTALAAPHFCMVHDPSTGFQREVISSVPPDAASDTFSTYPPSCKHDSERYHVAITRTSIEGEYRITARWESIFAGNSEVLIMYKL